SGFEAARWGQRPFRAPHHSASAAALVGGGQLPRPGEISLAHHGVLFLDELPEFDRDVLEALREPIDTGRIAISRAARHMQFPARCVGLCGLVRRGATGREAAGLLRDPLARLLLSARAYLRALRVARTIADLAGAATVAAEHVAEAIHYRRLDARF